MGFELFIVGWVICSLITFVFGLRNHFKYRSDILDLKTLISGICASLLGPIALIFITITLIDEHGDDIIVYRKKRINENE